MVMMQGVVDFSESLFRCLCTVNCTSSCLQTSTSRALNLQEATATLQAHLVALYGSQ